MAKFWTWAEIRAKVERDLDLEGETFITSSEMLGYANEAIDEVERQIHTLYEDYFVKPGVITLVQGTDEYALPTDIYANKIRALVYRNGNTVYPVKRIYDWRKFENYELEKANTTGTTAQYFYMLINSSAGAPKILLSPTPNESGSYLRIWYLRNANELTADSSVCDIPEAVNYVIQYIKVRCYEKEGNPMLQKAMADLEAEKQTTLAVLSGAVPDNDNELEPDLRLYNDMN